MEEAQTEHEGQRHDRGCGDRHEEERAAVSEDALKQRHHERQARRVKRRDGVDASGRRSIAKRRPCFDGQRPRRLTDDVAANQQLALPPQPGLAQIAVRIGAADDGRSPMDRRGTRENRDNGSRQRCLRR